MITAQGSVCDSTANLFMHRGGNSCGTSSIGTHAHVARFWTADTARKRTAGAGSHNEARRAGVAGV